MGSVRFRLPSPSMAVALVALFVALGGSSYAALKVSSRQIVNNSVRSADLRNNDVRARDVRNNSLTGADINEARLGTVPSAAGASTLGGSTLAQVRAGIDAATLGGTPRSAFYSAGDVDQRLPRAAETRSVGEQNISAGNPVDRITVRLTAPRAGFAFVVGSGNVHPGANITLANHQCAVEMFVPEIPQVGRAVSFKTGDTTIDYESLANSWIVPVDAGTHTFTLRLAINNNVSTNCTDQIASASSSLNAIWLPDTG